MYKAEKVRPKKKKNNAADSFWHTCLSRDASTVAQIKGTGTHHFNLE